MLLKELTVPAPALAGIPESTKLDSQLKREKTREGKKEKNERKPSLQIGATSSLCPTPSPQWNCERTRMREGRIKRVENEENKQS